MTRDNPRPHKHPVAARMLRALHDMPGATDAEILATTGGMVAQLWRELGLRVARAEAARRIANRTERTAP